MKVHLIGICGTGMGSLAGLLKAAGHDVRGSDEHVYPPMSVQLEEQGIPCFEGFRAREPGLGAGRASSSATSAARTTSRCWRRRSASIPLESFPSLFSKLFLQDAAHRGARWSSRARTARRRRRRCSRTC